jgi:integrase
MAKRANGLGSKPKQRADGRWVSHYYVRVAGVQKRRSVYGRTPAETERNLIAALGKGPQSFDARGATVAEYLRRWLDASVSGSVGQSTEDDYRKCCENYVIPHLGHIHLRDLGGEDVQDLYAAMLSGRGFRRPLSPVTVGHVHRTLRRALDRAVRWKMIESNPALDADPPRRPKRPHAVLSADEIARFAEVSSGKRLFPLWITTALTGLRAGAVLGLKWSDLVRDKATGATLLVVRRKLVSTSAGVSLEEGSKTGAGSTLRLPALAASVLAAHRKRQLEERLAAGARWEDLDLIFTTSTGRWIHPNNVSAYLRRDLTAAGLPRVRFHDLRHSFATMLAHDGLHHAVISAALGHSSPAVTMGIYTHASVGMQELAAQRLDAMFPPPSEATAPANAPLSGDGGGRVVVEEANGGKKRP